MIESINTFYCTSSLSECRNDKIESIDTFYCTSSLQEFVLATNMTSCGSIEDKMRWAFKIYDEDNSG